MGKTSNHGLAWIERADNPVRKARLSKAAPIGIGRIARQRAVIISCAVGPPDTATITKAAFGNVYRRMHFTLGYWTGWHSDPRSPDAPRCRVSPATCGIELSGRSVERGGHLTTGATPDRPKIGEQRNIGPRCMRVEIGGRQNDRFAGE